MEAYAATSNKVSMDSVALHLQSLSVRPNTCVFQQGLDQPYLYPTVSSANFTHCNTSAKSNLLYSNTYPPTMATEQPVISPQLPMSPFLLPLMRLSYDERKSLSTARVVQGNIVCVFNLPSYLEDGPHLKDSAHFGKYGPVIKSSNAQKGAVSAFVVYKRCQDALKAIIALSKMKLAGKQLKATLGSAVYCKNTLRGLPCTELDCVKLHYRSNPDATFNAEQMANGLHIAYQRKKLIEIYQTYYAKRAPTGQAGTDWISPVELDEYLADLSNMEFHSDSSYSAPEPPGAAAAASAPGCALPDDYLFSRRSSISMLPTRSPVTGYGARTPFSPRPPRALLPHSMAEEGSFDFGYGLVAAEDSSSPLSDGVPFTADDVAAGFYDFSKRCSSIPQVHVAEPPDARQDGEPAFRSNSWPPLLTAHHDFDCSAARDTTGNWATASVTHNVSTPNGTDTEASESESVSHEASSSSCAEYSSSRGEKGDSVQLDFDPVEAAKNGLAREMLYESAVRLAELAVQSIRLLGSLPTNSHETLRNLTQSMNALLEADTNADLLDCHQSAETAYPNTTHLNQRLVLLKQHYSMHLQQMGALAAAQPSGVGL